jgi:hypothetical protein
MSSGSNSRVDVLAVEKANVCSAYASALDLGCLGSASLKTGSPVRVELANTIAITLMTALGGTEAVRVA